MIENLFYERATLVLKSHSDCDVIFSMLHTIVIQVLHPFSISIKKCSTSLDNFLDQFLNEEDFGMQHLLCCLFYSVLDYPLCFPPFMPAFPGLE